MAVVDENNRTKLEQEWIVSGVAGIVLGGLVVLWVVLLFLTFRSPDAPKFTRLLLFQALLLVTFILLYFFLVKVYKFNPNPTRVKIAHNLTQNKMIDLATVVPGVPDALDDVYRVDTDGNPDEDIKEEWVVFYQYDTREDVEREQVRGPYGGAIYDPDRCRPPVIHSFELAPVNYEYLGEDGVSLTVDNIIKYQDPFSPDPPGTGPDRPEVIVEGVSRGIVTDLNIFRKVGWDEECVSRRTVEMAPPPAPDVIPSIPRQIVTVPFVYDNIGSFRGSYQVERSGAKVTVKDRAGFERSQIVTYREYTPKDGTYFQPYTLPEVEPGPSRRLVDPDEVGLMFGPGQPDETRQVYYPEKTVLAFFLQLGPDPDEAMKYTCQGKGKSEYHPEDYGLTLPLNDLEKVVVCELTYNPDVSGEQNHETQFVRAKVVEVEAGVGLNDCSLAHEVECTVTSAPNPKALPYGCEWCILECHPYP